MKSDQIIQSSIFGCWFDITCGLEDFVFKKIYDWVNLL